MAEVTAALVKELRAKTGAGMMDCKTALTESGGDMEAAVDWLRTKGLAAAAKKAGRVAAEGLIGIAASDGAAAVVEVNAETDFVARNEVFQALVRTIADTALAEGGDFDKTRKAAYADTGHCVEEHVTQAVATIRENIRFRRAAGLRAGTGVVASYVHNAAAPGLGRIGVLVALESTGDKEALAAFGKQLAMHIAASSPQAVSADDLDAAVVERERAVLAEQARESGRPPEIIEKMVAGRLRKFYEEVALLDQTYALDPEQKVSAAIEAAANTVGAPITVKGFVRFALGEGIEREESDFAAEVAAQVQG